MIRDVSYKNGGNVLNSPPQKRRLKSKKSKLSIHVREILKLTP